MYSYAKIGMLIAKSLPMVAPAPLKIENPIEFGNAVAGKDTTLYPPFLFGETQWSIFQPVK
ncbi:MAG: hypothetical protein WBG37_03360, partial [Desulfobacterales bacterium]